MCILQVSTLADHAHVGTCTSAVDLVHELCHSLASTDSELNTHTNSSFDIPPNILDTPTNTFISPSVCTLVSRLHRDNLSGG